MSNPAGWWSRLVLAGVALVVVALPSLAEARRRIVILEFEGPKAAQFRVDVERLVKKSHLVIPVDKWNAAAEEMDATSLKERDIKKVAKRLNVDGIISGKVEKRRDEYILRLKVREGTSGEVIGNPIDSKTGGPRLDGSSTREIKSELFDTLDTLDTGGGDEEASDEEAEPEPRRKFVKRGDAEDASEDEPRSAKGAKKPAAEDAEDEAEPLAKPAKGKKVEAEDDEAEPLAKPAKGKKVEVEDDEAEPLAKPAKGKKVDEPVELAKPAKGKKVDEPVELAKPAKGKKVEEPVEVAKPTKGKKVEEPVEVAKPTKGKDPADGGKETSASKPAPLLAAVAKKSEGKPFVPKTRTKTTAKAPPKEVARVEDDDDDDADDADDDDADASLASAYQPLDDGTALNHAHRAIDVTGGISFTQRRLRYKSSGLAAPATPPRSYDSVPVAGFMLDGEFYPMAYGHKRRGVLTNIGVTAMFDRTFRIRTRLRYSDAATGAQREKELQSTYQRFALGAVYRHNLGRPDKPLVVTGSLRFGQQSFSVDRGGLDAAIVDIPEVKYTMFEPSAGVRYALGRKMSLGGEVGAMLMTSIGPIQNANQYGPATVTGFEGETFFDYMVTPKIFARASARIETIGMKFKGFGMLSNMRDGDPDQEVKSARDTYFGGAVTAGYVF